MRSRFSKFISTLQSDKRLLFFCFWAAVGCLYLPAYKAGFIADFMNALVLQKEGSFLDFINREGAYVKSLYQVTQLQLYFFISLFGTQPIPWFLLFTGLHALNGVLSYVLFSRLFEDFKLSSARYIAIAGTLLFLFNPNITEVTIWKGGYHYLTGVMMQLLLLIWCQRYLATRSIKYVWWSVALFVVSTFTLEIFYAIPFLTLFLLCGYYWKEIVGKQDFKRALGYFFLPQLGLFIVHLCTYRTIYGTWIAHYGSTQDFAVSINDVWPRVTKYLAYILLMAGHWPYEWREKLYSFLSLPVVYYGVIAFLLFFAVYILYRFKKIRTTFQVSGFLLGAIVCSLILIVPIYFDDLFSIYNSRRCYELGLFSYMLIALVVFGSIRNFKMSMVISSLYLIICMSLTVNMIFRWRSAAKIQYGVLRTFRHQTDSPVLLLNIPTYYKDVRIIQANKENEFNEQLNILRKDSVSGKLYSVSSYNMLHTWDGAHVTVLDSMTLKVTLNQWGSWWMYRYQGASSYENELYKVDMTDQGHEYILKLKEKPAKMVILYQQDEQWREVDFKKVGIEQW